MSEISLCPGPFVPLMMAISHVNSGQKISNIGPCPNCPAETVPYSG
ncbi:12844_t:CDS:1, partial [Funneliformis geosporum]